MTRYWWVNHNLTARQEIEGQYLWSPKVESNGARSEFYANMRRATPGDLVLSYAAQAVRHVGQIADIAFTAPKPEEFGSKGAYWSGEGWLLPVFWTPLKPPVSPKKMIDTLGPLLPARYSPINRVSGSGNQKAYLAEVSKDVFALFAAAASFSERSLTHGGANSLNYQAVSEMLDDAVEIRITADLALEDTVRTSVIQARRGQGKFRANVESLEQCCRLTGITNPALLVASHIKPWRLCVTAHERLDGMNGLLLTPDADLLFDRGFVSFQEDGEVLVSPRANKADLRRLGFDQPFEERLSVAEPQRRWRTDAFSPLRHEYLAYHRSEIFIS